MRSYRPPQYRPMGEVTADVMREELTNLVEIAAASRFVSPGYGERGDYVSQSDRLVFIAANLGRVLGLLEACWVYPDAPAAEGQADEATQ